MTERELKQKLYNLVSIYFGGAAVSWGKVSGTVKSGSPAIVLNTGDIKRSYQPIRKNIEGVSVNSYPSSTTLQVDLYTKGEKVIKKQNVTAANENTAVNDLVEFVNFLGSEWVDVWTFHEDITIIADTVRNLSDIINDVRWEYRAMVELEIWFTQSAAGHTGTMWDGGVAYDENGNPLSLGKFKPNSSGGGTQELADDTTGWFEQVEIEEEKELFDKE